MFIQDFILLRVQFRHISVYTVLEIFLTQIIFVPLTIHQNLSKLNPLGLKNLFSLDRCLVYTGSNYIDIK
jgi:flagellar biosynthesis protein FlhB